MAGHSKWATVEHFKGGFEAKRGEICARLPKENVKPAIRRGIGDNVGVVYGDVAHEAFDPRGLALLVALGTDSHRRTAVAIRSLLTKSGGSGLIA